MAQVGRLNRAQAPVAKQAGRSERRNALGTLDKIARGVEALGKSGQKAASSYGQAEAVRYAAIELRDAAIEARERFLNGDRVVYGAETRGKARSPRGEPAELLKAHKAGEVVRHLKSLEAHVAAAGLVAQRNSADYGAAEEAMFKLDEVREAVDGAISAFLVGDRYTFGG